MFVIAEIGVNHGGSLSLAMQMIEAAAGAGADAVKFQTFRADRLLVRNEDRYAQQGDGEESAFRMFQRLELGREEHCKLKAFADAKGVVFLSTPFDEESADFLEELGVPAFKIASGDITHLPLLRHVAAKGKPVLLSTGMSYLNEIADAVWALRNGGAAEIVLLHCVSTYPAQRDSLNLRAVQTLREHFGLPVGYSDHSKGILFPLVAVALGASVLEKHFTLDKDAPGPDHALSLDPTELAALVRHVREVESALGDGRKRPSPAEEENRVAGRRSIVAGVDIRAYETIAPWMLAVKRPGTGIEPKHLEKVIGMQANRDLPRDAVLTWEALCPSRAPDLPAETDPAVPPDSPNPDETHA